MPLFNIRGVVFLATANPQAIPTLDEVQEHIGFSVRPVLAVKEDILQALNSQEPGAEYAADLVSMLDEDFEVE